MPTTYPRLFRVRQRFDAPELPDIEAAVQEQLDRILAARPVARGQRVAITAGSRGIGDIVPIIRAAASRLLAIGAVPLVVPAMGSHGGGTAEGQKALLASYGITEAALGCPIEASMETVVLGTSPEGIPIHFDRVAYQADHILVCNRIKPHTRFVGPYESGLMKMLLIGLGKAQGAQAYHRAIADLSFEQIVREIGAQVLSQTNLLGGLAIVENARDRTALLRGLLPEEFMDQEPALLDLAKRWMARLPFDRIDLLLVDQIGKDISGLGLDPNVVGRKYNLHRAIAGESPRVKLIAVRGLTEATRGNAAGIGMAEFCRTDVLARIDRDATRLNALTAGNAPASMTPLDYASDQAILDAALPTIGMATPPQARLVWITDTLRLDVVGCAEAFLDEARQRDDLDILHDPMPLPWSAEGDLPRLDRWPLPADSDTSSRRG